MSTKTARHFLAALRPAILLLATAMGLSCAAGPRPEANPADWSLSPSAETGYQYMVYLDAVRTGNALEADAALSRVLELDKRKEIYLELSELKWRIGKPEEAEAILMEALARYPGDKWLTLRLADVYRLQQRYDEASALLDSKLGGASADSDILLRQARIALEAGKHAKVRDILSRLPTAGLSAEALYLRAKSESGLGQNRKAISTLRKALEKDPSYLPGVVELAYLLEMENNFAEAERAYMRLIELGETSTEAWVKLIELNLKLNNPEKALTLAQIGPQDKAFLLEAARLFLSQKFFDEAAEVLGPLAHGNPVDPEVRFFLALLEYEGRRDPQAALTQLEWIPQESPYHPRAFGFRAQILFAQEHPQQALDTLQQARKQYPDEPEFPDLQAWILSSLGRHAEAEQVLTQALAVWPESGSLLYRLGLVQEDQGRSIEALLTMERVISINPNMADALNFIGYVLADQGRDLPRALELITKALALKPDSGYIIDSLAWTLHKMGQHDKAMAEIAKAVALEEEDPSIWEHYGDIALAMGKRKEARKGYSNAIKHGSQQSERVKKKLEGL